MTALFKKEFLGKPKDTQIDSRNKTIPEGVKALGIYSYSKY